MSVVPQVPVMGDTLKPRPTYVLIRGVYTDHGDEVQPQGLDADLPVGCVAAENRIGLARWLFDPKHPLTRACSSTACGSAMFGRGLVETSEDFGSQGSIPSHPELLDWLAVTFVESGWDIKALQKQIVMSATFRQRRSISDELLKKDPRNVLLARFSRVRMPAEMVRDKALAASGLLVRAVGGKSVYPYQPMSIWDGLAALRLSGGRQGAGRCTSSPHAVFVHQAQRAAPGDGDLRHAGSRHQRRPAADVEHAAAGARAARRSAVPRGLSRAGGERAARRRRCRTPR